MVKAKQLLSPESVYLSTSTVKESSSGAKQAEKDFTSSLKTIKERNSEKKGPQSELQKALQSAVDATRIARKSQISQKNIPAMKGIKNNKRKQKPRKP